MKTILFLFILLSLTIKTKSQFNYGTPLVEGSISLRISETREEYCGKILRRKTTLDANYSTNLNGIINWDKSEISRQNKMAKDNGYFSTAAILNNYSETRKEGEDFGSAKPSEVPLYTVIANVKTIEYGTHPCPEQVECSDDYVAIQNKIGTFSGPVSHHGKSGVIFKCSVEGMKKSTKYLLFSVFLGGTWFDGGKMENSQVIGKVNRLVMDEESSECKAIWKAEEGKYLVNLQSDLESGHINPSNSGDGVWVGQDGIYVRNEEEYEGDEISSRTREELELMRIDTASFFKFIRDKPQIQTYNLSGFYKMVRTEQSGNKTVIIRRIDATFTIGKRPDFTIEGEKEQDFKEWIPGHPDYPETFKPVSLKAKYSETSQKAKDTITFEIVISSHLPGYCTNYPILPDNPPSEQADLFFAPQEEQTDPNIKVLNDSTAITTKKVQEAVVVIHSRDFGAHCKVRAWAFSNGDLAKCPYDNEEDIRVPYDMNRNYIADKWEEDMGIKDVYQLDDKDNLPANQANEGDGLTVFEEYRGFVCEKDVEAPSDKGHMNRNGKHVRTSPLCKDVFIFDNDKLFEKYYESPNPAETHWHYINSAELKLPPFEQVLEVIKVTETDCPEEKDTSPKAVKMRSDYKKINGYLANWEKKDYRRINANTPRDYRNNKQFAMYLVESPFSSTTGGVSVTNAKSVSNSPLFNYHLIVLPQYKIIKKRINEIFSGLAKSTNHPRYIQDYSPDILDQLSKTVYEAMVPHEIGHGLGITHHTKGGITFLSSKTKSKIKMTTENSGITFNDTTETASEINYADGQTYNITYMLAAFWAMGVTECCMRYTIERETDFIEKKVLKPSVKYCRKGQSFIDGNGNKTEADGCFSKIQVKCDDVQ
jgi:hypothetical protein